MRACFGRFVGVGVGGRVVLLVQDLHQEVFAVELVAEVEEGEAHCKGGWTIQELYLFFFKLDRLLVMVLME